VRKFKFCVSPLVKRYLAKVHTCEDFNISIHTCYLFKN